MRSIPGYSKSWTNLLWDYSPLIFNGLGVWRGTSSLANVITVFKKGKKEGIPGQSVPLHIDGEMPGVQDLQGVSEITWFDQLGEEKAET